MHKTVFISRPLGESSAFAARLRAAGWRVQGRSLLTLTPAPFFEVPAADWLFFASKNAVRFFFSQAASGAGAGGPLPAVAALGAATAAEIRRYRQRVDFTGTGHPDTTARLFRPLAAGKRILFPAARHSRRSVPGLLADVARVIHLTVYDNAPAPDLPRIDAGVLVFTSPMNARAYFALHALQAGQQLVAIGQTTAAELAALGCPVSRVAAEPSETALAEAVLAAAN